MPPQDESIHPSPLTTAGRLLAERGLYTLVWFGEDLVVTARYGRLACDTEVDDPICVACLPLIGLEDEILALRTAPAGSVLELPAVAVVASDGTSQPRLNITIFWFAEISQFLMLVARATSRSDVEGELSRQMRARLMAEAELAAKSRALERANGDLEEFAAVISHDLKAPLRALRYAVQDLKHALHAGDLAGAEAHLDEIEKRSRRMSDMTTSLLDYASVGRKADIVEEVDLRSLLDAIIGSLEVPAGFRIDVAGSWPRVETVPAAFDLVARNLVDNALKHHDRDTGLVTISCLVGGDETSLEITVADDGPGIAAEHHHSILLPFRRLQPEAADDTASSGTGPGTGPGTGMGLTYVCRTLDAVGARLEIHSDPLRCRGTTFKIFWPLMVRC